MQDDTASNLGPTDTPESSFYRDDSEQAGTNPDFAPPPEVNWTASEYIDHKKTPIWYIALILTTVIVSGGIYLISQDVLTMVAIIVVAISFGFFASRPPRTLDYAIESRGIIIGDKLYPYSILRTFSIQPEKGFNSLQLIPLKRFMPAISVYYPPDQEDKIIDALSNYLPHEERRPDPIEKLMRHIRF